MRKLLISWLYFLGVAHFLCGVGMTWFSEYPWLADYHATVLRLFYLDAAVWEVKALQVWWVSLFGATLQAFSLFMLLLIYLGDRFHLQAVWLGLAVVILVWAPQDIFISVQKYAWLHLWVDLAAVCAIVPPSIYLWWLDRTRQHKESFNGE